MNPPDDPCTCVCEGCVEGNHCGKGEPHPDVILDPLGSGITHCYYPTPEEARDWDMWQEWESYRDDMIETGSGR